MFEFFILFNHKPSVLAINFKRKLSTHYVSSLLTGLVGSVQVVWCMDSICEETNRPLELNIRESIARRIYTWMITAFQRPMVKI